MDINDPLIELVDKRNEARSAYLRYLLLIASGVLSVLISFNNFVFDSCVSHLFFNLSLLSLLLGILSGAFFLYGDVHIAYEKVSQTVKRRLQQEQDGIVDKSSFYKKPKIFLYCEKSCYVLLIIAVISLVAYTLSK